MGVDYVHGVGSDPAYLSQLFRRGYEHAHGDASTTRRMRSLFNVLVWLSNHHLHEVTPHLHGFAWVKPTSTYAGLRL